MSTHLSFNRDHCEDEPIRYAQAIQPSGVLLCVDSQTNRIISASANYAMIPALQESPVGHRLPEVWPELALACRNGTFNVGNGYMGRSHSDDNTAYIEIEPYLAADHLDTLDLVEMGATLIRVHDAQTLEEVTHEAASAIQSITGMERVLIYRFDRLGHGEVLAESKISDWEESFIGFHFPSADIPSQARELYLISLCRFVERRDYKPVPLVPELDTRNGQPFDLARCRLRSLSPAHRLYQENLGVDGSMSISIIDDGRLWGLVVGHHRRPHRVPIPAREQAMAVTTSLAMRIAATESADDRAARERHVTLHAKLLEQIAGADDLVTPLMNGEVKLADLFFTSGSLVLVNAARDGEKAKVLRSGISPDPELIAAFCDACRAHLDDGIFHTDNAASVLPEFAAHAEYASGVLAASIGENGSHMVLWFRPETIRTISWGGATPEFVEKEKASGNYLPRKSFTRWVEEVRGYSLPWRQWQIDIARSLRAALNELTIRQFKNTRDREINTALRDANAILVTRTAELEMANTELFQARERAEAGNKAKSEFLSVMNHEFHTPLNAIIGFADLMSNWEKTEPKDPVLGIFSSHIVEGGRSLLALLDDILSLAQLTSGDLKLQFSPFPLDRMTDTAITMVQGQADTAHVHLCFDSSGSSIQIDGDEEALLKVLVHILRNAIEFSNHGGDVKLRVSTSEAGLNIIVTDNGIGIANLEKAQAPFSQVDSSSTRRFGGIGVGLPLAKRLIECHGGTFNIKSIVDVGTIVTMIIPRDRICAPSESDHEPELNISTTNRLYITGSRSIDRNPQKFNFLIHLAESVDDGLSLMKARANERLLKTIIDGIPAMIAYWDKHLRCKFVNSAYLDWFGKTPEQVIEQTLPELLGERLFLLNEPFIIGALAGIPQYFERQLIKADGTVHDTWANYIPHIDKDGCVCGFFVLVSDITKLNFSERALMETESLLRIVQDNVHDGVITLDGNGSIISTNVAILNLFGYKSGDLVAQNITMLMPELYRRTHSNIVAQHQSQVTDKFVGAGTAFVGLTKQGAEFPINIRLIELSSGEKKRFIAFIHKTTT